MALTVAADSRLTCLQIVTITRAREPATAAISLDLSNDYQLGQHPLTRKVGRALRSRSSKPARTPIAIDIANPLVYNELSQLGTQDSFK